MLHNKLLEVSLLLFIISLSFMIIISLSFISPEYLKSTHIIIIIITDLSCGDFITKKSYKTGISNHMTLILKSHGWPFHASSWVFPVPYPVWELFSDTVFLPLVDLQWVPPKHQDLLKEKLWWKHKKKKKDLKGCLYKSFETMRGHLKQ